MMLPLNGIMKHGSRSGRFCVQNSSGIYAAVPFLYSMHIYTLVHNAYNIINISGRCRYAVYCDQIVPER